MSVTFRKLSLIVGFILALINICPSKATNSSSWQVKGIADGAGVWVNMWNYPADADSYCLKLYSSGIRNIFIQSSRSNTEAICNPQGLSRLLNAAHRYQMRVIAWSFDELNNPITDAKKVIAVANFSNAEGEKVDAVAANLEKDLSPGKINLFCEKIKQELGNSYPLVAVVYSPLNRASVVSTIPWSLLSQQFSVLAIMSYWNSKYIATSGAYPYTLSTIKRIRELTGRPDLDIHMIGDGMGTSPESISQFLLACKKGAATSASLYPNQQVTNQQLSALSHYPEFFPANGRFRLAAFKELTKNGKLSFPSGEDPSNSISRGHFYQLLVRQFYSAHNLNNPYTTDSRENSEDAIQEDDRSLAILTNAGITSALPATGADTRQFLTNPLTSKEAFDIVAKVIESRSQAKSNRLVGQSKALVLRTTKQAKQLFAQPAYAAESVDEASPLSYLDAAQIVLLASGGAK